MAYFGFLAKYLAIVSTVGHLVVVFDAACGRYLIQLTNSGALSDDVVWLKSGKLVYVHLVSDGICESCLICLTDSVIFSDDVLNAVLCNSGELIALVDTRFLKLGVCGTCSKLLHLGWTGVGATVDGLWC